MDPYEAPSAALSSDQIGKVEVAVVIQRAVSAALRNLLPAIGFAVVALLAYVASVCTLVGWIVVLPMLYWGFHVFMLEAEADHATVSSAWSATRSPGRAIAQMWLYILVFLFPITVINMTPTVAWNVMQTGQAFPVQPVNPMVPTVFSTVLGLGLGILLCRLLPATYFIVERGQNAINALSTSWTITGPMWRQMFALLLIGWVVTLPGSILSIGSQWVMGQVDGGVYDESLRLPAVGALVAGGLWAVAASFFAQLLWTVAYRQLTGPPPPAEAP